MKTDHADNLRRDFTHEERVENGRKGGIASAVSRRRTKTFREAFRVILDTDGGSEEQRAALEAMGLEPTWRNLITLSSLKKAAGGDNTAIAFVRDTVGEKPRDGRGEEREDRPMGELDLSGLTDEELRALAAKGPEWGGRHE